MIDFAHVLPADDLDTGCVPVFRNDALRVCAHVRVQAGAREHA